MLLATDVTARRARHDVLADTGVPFAVATAGTRRIGDHRASLPAGHGVDLHIQRVSKRYGGTAALDDVDLRIASGDEIPIEDRTPREVTHIGEHRITPENVPVYNYAFDVTPAELIAGIVTERGVLTAPYVESIRAIIGAK